MADLDIFVWLERRVSPSELETFRAATIVADRLCGSVANPIIRNAQEKRQLAVIADWLGARHYQRPGVGGDQRFDNMPPGSFDFRMNVPGTLASGNQFNIPVDVVIMPKAAKAGDLPVFFEAKSAGDFTNVNKRRKEEASKVAQLRRAHGNQVQFNLFLCGTGLVSLQPPAPWQMILKPQPLIYICCCTRSLSWLARLRKIAPFFVAFGVF